MSWEEIKNKYKNTNTYFKSSEEINNSIDKGKNSWNRIKNKYLNSTNNTSSNLRSNSRRSGEEFINRLKTNATAIQKKQNEIPTYMRGKQSLWDSIKNIATNNEIKFRTTYNKDVNNNSTYTPFLQKNQGNTNEKLTYNLLSKNKTQTHEELLERLSNMNNAQRASEIRAITKNEDDFNKLNLEAIQYKQSKEASKKAEKVNQDIDNGNYISAVEHILGGVPTKALDSITTTVSSMPSILPAKKINSSQIDGDELLKVNKILSKKYEETTSNIDSDIVKTASSISGTIGAMTPSILSNLMIPGSSKIVQAVNTSADAYQETLNDNTNNKTQALLTGIAKGGTSYAIEGITGGNFLGKGSLDDIAKKTISNNLSSPISKRIASKLYEVGGEIFEEEIENQAGYVIDKIINNKDITAKEWWNDATETAKNTLLTTVVLNLLGLGGNTYNEILKNENDTQLKKIAKQAENIIKNENLKVDINNTQSQENVNKINSQNIESQQDSILKQQNYYQYKQTDNPKINNLRKDMSKYWNNSQKTIDLANTIEKIITDKNYNIRLDDSITNKNGQSVNAQIKTLENGEIEIKINPNSKNVGEFLIMHETTHAIGTQEMKDLVMDYASKNSEFNNALESLKQTYGVEDVSDEVLSDISAQLFGNQEFINNLSMKKPSIFKRIYNKIIELANKITGNSNEALFIKNLKNKWEEAYRTQNNNLDENTHFSVIYNNDGSFNRVKITDNIFENNNNKSITRTIKDYLTEHIGEYADIIESGQRVYLGEDLPGEYAFSKSATNLPVSSKLAKGRAATGIKEIINNATNRQYEANRKTKHNIDAKYGFYRYDTNFSFDYKGKEQLYSGTILIRNDSNGKKFLYDITDIKKIGSNLLPVASNSRKSSAIIGSSNSLPINSIPSTKDNVNSTTKYSMQEPENNSASSFFDKNAKRYEDLLLSNVINYNKRNNGTINIEIFNNDELINQFTVNSKNEIIKQLGTNIGNYIYENANEKSQELKLNKKEKNKYKAYKEKQLEIINNTNPMLDDYHVGIRSIEDIKTFEEVINDDESFAWGDFSKEDAEKALKSGKITVYSSYPIKQGTFVSTSKIQAEEYAGGIGSKIYQKTIPLNQVAWINGDEGQYAKINDAQYSLPTKEWSEHLKDNYKATGTRTNLENIKLPTRRYIDEMSLSDYLDARGLDYEIDEDGNLISVEDRQAVKDYLIEKHRREAIQKQKKQEIKIGDNYKTDLEAFKEETNKLNLPTNENINNTVNTELLTDEDYKVLNDIYEKEGRTEILTEKKKANILEKYANDKYTFKNSLDILAQKFINKGHFVDKLSEQTKNPELKFLYDRNLNSFAEGQYVIGIAQTDNNGNKIGKSINDIWKPVEDSKLTKEFSEYLLHKLNIDRGERNKFVFGKEIGPTESTKIALELENKHPEFKRYAQDIKNFNHNNLLNLKEAGLITQETIDYLEKLYPYYVPISRDKDGKIFVGDNERTGTNLPIKKATGGSSDIQPIKDTMAQQAIRIKRLINQNKLGQELVKTLKNAKVEQQADIQYTPDALMEYETLVEADNKGNKYYTYFEDGYMQKLKISDELYESLKPTKISELEKTLPVKALQKITNIHRSLLTSSNPVFIVSNFFKDVQDGMFNSKYSSKFIKNYGKALHEIITKGKYYESYMANGGMTNTYFDYNEGVKNKRNKFVEKIRSTNEIVEQLPRLSEFISTLEDGKSLNEALYNAAEITTNFKRGGEITKAINRNGVNFLNASIQGLDKQFRNFSGQNGAKGYANLLLKATILGVAPSVLNHILLDDDDDYEDLPENTKDLYYLFKYDDGKFIRIPKGRVLSIFGSSARRILETIQGKEDSFDGFTDTLINQMAPNNPLEDNILAPIIQVKNNRTWYGGEIVSSSTEKNVLPKNQYDETTDEFSKWIGKQLNVSPKKVNYLIDQYSGGVGDVILPMITPQAKQNVFKDKFTTDSVMKNKNVGKFYETLEKQTQISDDSFATDEDKLQSQFLNEISGDMSDLYKEKREIQMSDISNSEKTEKVRKIQEEINKLAEKGLEDYSRGTYKKNSAKIGDIEYYKDGKGEWTKLTEEEISKNKNISTETYATYKQKIYKETQNKRKSGELTENQNLKSADKIQILLDSKYSEKEIGAIYENYIKGEKDIEYNIMKNARIDTKEYLKYKQQEFTSDKKDDGTLDGKTVSKSKQKKVVEYLNTMNITGNQRLLLYAMQGYTTTSSQKNQLANYVQGLKLDKDTKLKLYDKFSGFKVYKNGRVTW